MKAVFLLLNMSVIASVACAELPPALKAVADKFESSYAAVAAAAVAQLEPVRQRYLDALNVAQQAATAAGKTADIAAITAEINGVRTGDVVETFPPDLPRELAQARRNYVTVATSNARTIPPKQRELATQYLQSLGILDLAAVRNRDAALSEAIATEKARVQALLDTAGGGQKNHNVAPDGDFSQGQANAFPPGWKGEADDVTVNDATIVTEGSEKFLRFRRLQAMHRADLIPEKEITIPARTKWVEFSVRMRVKGLVLGKDYDPNPGMHVFGRDARGEMAGTGWAMTKQDTAWKRFAGRLELPPTAKTLQISVGPHGAAGVMDFDDIVVEFK